MTITDPDDGKPAVPEDTPDAADEHAAPTGAVALRGVAGNLTIDPSQKTLTSEQRASLVAIGIGPDVPLAHVRVFIHVCQMRGLDPWAREAYLIGRKSKGGVVKYTIQTGIDGFRKLGEDTGQYRGQVGPEWCGEDFVWKPVWLRKWGYPVAARVGLLRAGFDAPVFGTAMWDEYVPMEPVYENNQRTDKTKVSQMWEQRPAGQLAKCAEALAWRRTFPRQTSGLYVPEEMARADQEAAEAQTDAAADRRRQYLADRERPAVEQHPREQVIIQGSVAESPTDEEPPSEVAPEPTEAQQRRWLLDELAAQAAGLFPDLPREEAVTRLTHRFVAGAKKPIPDFTAAELIPVVENTRKVVLGRLSDPAKRAAYAECAGRGAVEDAAVILRGPKPKQHTTDDGHKYDTSDGTLDGPCTRCGQPFDDHITPDEGGR